jgi:ketosteroid isomerase-like protein
MSQENVATVRASLDAWNRGDVDAWLEPAHPEIEWVSQIAQASRGPRLCTRRARAYFDQQEALDSA